MKLLVHPLAAVQLDALVAAPGGTVLLYGPRQVGKFAAARELARQMNCTAAGGGTCQAGSCRSCRMVAGGNHPNLVIVTPDDKRKIGVEAVHELQHGLSYQQYEASGRRVIIIRDADRLTLPAQQALLKTLEEPPVGTTIILTAEQPMALLPTVLSRCRQIFIPPVPAAQLAAELPELLKGVSSAQAVAAAAASHGLPGRAIGYTENPDHLEADRSRAITVRQFLEVTSLFERLQLAAQLAASADERPAYLDELTAQVRSCARSAASNRLAALLRLQERLAANVNPKTAFEALAVELA